MPADRASGRGADLAAAVRRRLGKSSEEPHTDDSLGPITTRKKFLDLAREGSPLIAVDLPGGLQLFVATSDKGTSRFLAVKQRWPGEQILRSAVRHLRRLGRSRNGLETFVDLGAAEGAATLVAVKKLGFRDAVSVEPNPSKFRLLRTNMVANGVTGRVRCANFGITATNAVQRPYRMSISRWQSASLNDTTDAVEDPGATEQVVKKVPLKTLDELVSAGVLPTEGVSLAWLDVDEPLEPIVLHGGSLFKAGIPVVARADRETLTDRAGILSLGEFLEQHCRTVVDLGGKRKAQPPVPPAGFSELLAEHAEAKIGTRLLFVPPERRALS